MMEWIKVSDKLPEFSRTVLLYWNEVICIGSCEEYGDGYQFTDGHIDDTYDYVTHWMPLPEPPQQ
jgi:hypothetical protein